MLSPGQNNLTKPIIALTDRGKSAVFMIPSLLIHNGSAVVLDVKGKNFCETQHFRSKIGTRGPVSRRPTGTAQPFGPPARIAARANPDWQEMEPTAKPFLRTDNDALTSYLSPL